MKHNRDLERLSKKKSRILGVFQRVISEIKEVNVEYLELKKIMEVNLVDLQEDLESTQNVILENERVISKFEELLK